MKLKTQFIICLIVFTIVLSAITASVATTEQQVSYLNDQQEISKSIERGASSLNSVSIDYFLYQEDLQLSRWEAVLSSLSHDLANLETNNAEQKKLAENVASDLGKLNTQFDGLASFLENTQRNVSVRIDPAFQFMWSGMAVQSQTLSFDASQLSQSINDQIHQVNDGNILLVLSLVGTFGAFLATIYFMVFRKTLKAVTKLQKGIDTIGSGNIDYTINVEGRNEIAQLSNAFNQMTANLKVVTASKTDLEREIAERKKVEEALRKSEEVARNRAEDLEELHIRLEDKAAEVEEFANQMEQLARDRLEKLKDAERLATIGKVAGMVGHDIRNPLQAIIGEIYLAISDLELLPTSAEKASAIESLQETEKNVEYINKIVADLQDYSRVLKPFMKETNLEELCHDVLYKNGIPKTIEASCKVESELKSLKTDPDLLKRILLNLVSNAVQAMPNGGKLSLHAFRESSNIVITVQDTGIGIPDDIKPKIFTPLFTTRSKGQGFGLPVVKRMTEALGGAVTFQSQASIGTEFTVRLPFNKDQELV